MAKKMKLQKTRVIYLYFYTSGHSVQSSSFVVLIISCNRNQKRISQKEEEEEEEDRGGTDDFFLNFSHKRKGKKS